MAKEEPKKYAAYKKGDRVWQFEVGFGKRKVLERTVEADSGVNNPAVKLFEGPAHAVNKVLICRHGDVEAANEIMRQLIATYEIEVAGRQIYRDDFLREFNREDLIEAK